MMIVCFSLLYYKIAFNCFYFCEKCHWIAFLFLHVCDAIGKVRVSSYMCALFCIFLQFFVLGRCLLYWNFAVTLNKLNLAFQEVMCNYIFVNYEFKPLLSRYLHSVSSYFQIWENHTVTSSLCRIHSQYWKVFNMFVGKSTPMWKAS